RTARHLCTGSWPPSAGPLLQIEHQAAKALREWHRLLVGLSRLGPRRGGYPRPDRPCEGRLLDVPRGRPRALELLAQRGQMARDTAVAPKMGESEPARAPGLDRLQRPAPGLQIDVGRRRGGYHAAVTDAHAGHVAGEGVSARL